MTPTSPGPARDALDVRAGDGRATVEKSGGGALYRDSGSRDGADSLVARILGVGIWAFAAYAVGAFLYVTLGRLTYGGEINYIEGVVMDHVLRIANSDPIYVAPSLEFVPLAYMPGYPALVSILANAFGPAFWEARIVSLIGALITAFLIGVAVRRETRSWTFAVAGGSLFLMGLGIAGGHYDVGRPDLTTLALIMGSLVTLRSTSGSIGAIASGALLTAAFFTKQHAVWFALVSVIHVALNDRKRLLPFGLTLLLGCGGGYALLTWWLGPWFAFYTWDVPSHWSKLSLGRVHRYLGTNLAGTLGPLTLSTLAALVMVRRPLMGPASLWLWMVGAALGTGLMATLDPSAYKHLILPTLMVFCILGPIALERLVKHMSSSAPRVASHAWSLTWALLLIQFGILLYPLNIQRIHLGARSAHARVVNRIQEIQGPVIVLHHGFLAWQAGRRMGVHHLALFDVMRAKGNSLLRRDPDYFDRMFAPIRQGLYRPTIISDVLLENAGDYWETLTSQYRLLEDLHVITGDALAIEGTGMNVYPRYVYVPIERKTLTGSTSAPASQPAKTR